jgi:hypothetical protein
VCLKAGGDRTAARAALEQARAHGAVLLADAGLAGWDDDDNSALPVSIPPSIAAATETAIDAEPTVAIFLADQAAPRLEYRG